MKKYSLLFVILLLTIKCNPTKEASQQNLSNVGGKVFCEDFISVFIKGVWKTLERDTYRVGGTLSYDYVVGDKSYWEIAILANQFCLRGKTKLEVEELLGSPSSSYPSRNKYLYLIGNDSENIYWQLQFNYSDNDVLLSIAETALSID